MPANKRTVGGVLGGVLGLVGLSAVAGLLVTATITPALAVTGAAATSGIKIFDSLPGNLEIDTLMLPTTFYAKDPNTDGYVELTSFYEQDRKPVKYDEIAPVMIDAILSSEDPRYFTHGGIDLIGTARALLNNAGGGQTQGASSISQQYVKNVQVQKCEKNAPTEEERLNCFWKETSSEGTEGYQRKLQEMKYSIALEKRYSKEDILLGYLNIANFGGITYGIEAAANYYFSTTAANLTLNQAATLAGVVQNPNTFRIDKPEREVNGAADGYADTMTRRNYVLDRLLKDGKISQEQHDTTRAEPITPAINPTPTGCEAAGNAAYFCQMVKGVVQTDPVFGATAEERDLALHRGGLNIYTTLDYRILNPASEVQAELTPSYVEGMDFGSATASIEAETGRVLSITQNTLFNERQDVLDADPNYKAVIYAADKRFGPSAGIGFPVGSTFKVFTLINWLEKGHSVNETINARNRMFTQRCHGSTITQTERVGNFGGGQGGNGTPMTFTQTSLNSGYMAMAEQLDICDIGDDATKMGAVLGQSTIENTVPVSMTGSFSVLGSHNISPIAMAGAYATVANGGTYCEPKVIDRVTNSDGTELPIPERTCTPVLTPEVAATAAYTLASVMTNGTGTGANPYDGTQVLGKTGTHEDQQTWLVESSSKVATAAWVGNADGINNVFNRFGNIRYQLAKRVQAAADVLYDAPGFPRPDSNLTRNVMKELPNVVGLTVDDATTKLEDAGFQVIVGDPVPGSEAKGLISRQDPGAGQVAGGTTVTINPSDGRGGTVPDVLGQEADQAVSAIHSAGFATVTTKCTEKSDAPAKGTVTGVNPPAGTAASRDQTITIAVEKKTC